MFTIFIVIVGGCGGGGSGGSSNSSCPEEESDEIAIAFAQEIFELTNAARMKAGLLPLSNDEKLTLAAFTRAEEITIIGYFSHTRPNGKSWDSVLEELDVVPRSFGGENIAVSSGTAEAILNMWLNSPGHHANIMSDMYSHVGVGVKIKGG